MIPAGLTHCAGIDTVLDGFIPDLRIVLRAFLIAAGAFCSRRMSDPDWVAYIDDLTSLLRLATQPMDLWT